MPFDIKFTRQDFGNARRIAIFVEHLVYLISKDANRVFYLSITSLFTSQYNDYDNCVNSTELTASFKNCNVMMT